MSSDERPVGDVRYQLVGHAEGGPFVIERVKTLGRFETRAAAHKWMVDTADQRAHALNQGPTRMRQRAELAERWAARLGRALDDVLAGEENGNERELLHAWRSMRKAAGNEDRGNVVRAGTGSGVPLLPVGSVASRRGPERRPVA
ncbi:MAG: hypothetical protein ACR2KV_09885 [Solirubrobacteraceae bacterium]